MSEGKSNNLQINNAFESYNSYLAEEWKIFERDVDRREALLRATDGIVVKWVLDIGCGAGQEMMPFVSAGARGIGIDLMAEVGQVGRDLFGRSGLQGKVDFLRADGGVLPFASGCFDVVICRVAISFMDNQRALAEISRVLRPGGRFLFKYQAPAYYWWKFRNGIKERYLRSSIHAVRVLAAGCYYRYRGRQPFGYLTAGGEIPQSLFTLEREFDRIGLRITGEMPDTNRLTPSLIITKEH
jgi:SAM-dependent methyltransferase